ncbi:MAG: STAS domain-containing protein [Acetobacter papayae]|uniref:STAS domain-containing protein n=1 Tax=Acetobacter papayae TaxID=1076592 RepID=UPI0039EB4DB2
MANASGAAVSAVTVTLPERLDTAAAAGLKKLIEDALAQAVPGAVSLDASGVTYVGGLCLQLLLASGCTVAAPSEPFREAYALFGVGAFLPGQPASSKEQ